MKPVIGPGIAQMSPEALKLFVQARRLARQSVPLRRVKPSLKNLSKIWGRTESEILKALLTWTEKKPKL